MRFISFGTLAQSQHQVFTSNKNFEGVILSNYKARQPSCSIDSISEMAPF